MEASTINVGYFVRQTEQSASSVPRLGRWWWWLGVMVVVVVVVGGGDGIHQAISGGSYAGTFWDKTACSGIRVYITVQPTPILH